jgi:hypothetical protein
MDIKMEIEEGAPGETSIDEDLMDEAAARKAIEEGASTPPKSSSPGCSTAVDPNAADESIVLGEDEAKLLGLKDGGRMKKILDNDRVKKGKKKEKVLGIDLWDNTPRPPDRPIEIVKPEFPLSLANEHPVLRLLGNAWRNWSGKWASGVGVSIVLMDGSNRCWRCCNAGGLWHPCQSRTLQIRPARPISLGCR